ncbi:MAG: coproporphyrinogen-III oxidase family protein [Spirochaetia bacterium]
MAPPDPVLSLYVHVPFCTDKCLYCDFFSVPRRTVTPSIVENIVSETIALADRLVDAAGSGARLETLFVGGGTPSCLPREQLRKLLGGLRAHGCVEWTVESNPESLDEAFLDECRRAGVTRLSVGIQSLCARHLRTLRRRATPEHARAAIELLQKGWDGELNLDFITGIPGQTLSEVREDLSILGGGWPGHVSLYQLTREPGTPLEALVKAGRITLNRPEVDEELWLFGRDELISRGYRQYEVSNFALPGRECRHNLRYWRIDPYAGAGPGAVSTLPAAWAARACARPDFAANDSVVRLAAPKDLGAFLQGEAHFWGIQTELVGPSDFLLENIMMGLRLDEGIPEAALRSRFGRGFFEMFPGLWEGWINRGLALPAEGALRLHADGLLLLDRLLGEVVESMRRTPIKGLHVEWPDAAPQ